MSCSTVKRLNPGCGVFVVTCAGSAGPRPARDATTSAAVRMRRVLILPSLDSISRRPPGFSPGTQRDFDRWLKKRPGAGDCSPDPGGQCGSLAEPLLVHPAH